MRGDVTDHPDEVSRALRERSDRTCLHALLDSAGVPRRATTPAPMGLGATPGPDGVVDIPVGERDLTEEERVLWLLSERDAARRETADIRARLIGAGMTPSIPDEVDLSGPQVTATERELSTLEMVDALLEHVTVLRKQVHDLKGANRDLACQTEQPPDRDLLGRIRAAAQVALDNGSHTAAAKLLELEARLTSPYLT